MRRVLIVVAILLVLAGGVWFLQGINVLPGSYMSGRSQWAVNGGIAMLIGLGLLLFALRRRGTPPAGR